jgi:UDP-N-acetylmuramoyl-tripeptide--D-alanyl-D-alanine ligase
VKPFAWSDADVRRAVGLRTDLAEEGLVYTGVSTDSRSVVEGELYVAIVGERFDGHDFVADAFARGARGAVVARPVPGGEEARVYPVADTLVALGALAAYRRRLLDVPVVAITGSAGKTTTKDFASAAVGAAQRVHATAGNRNNRVGMPLTLLAVPDDAESVVLELGTNEPGEIFALGEIARPDVGVVTTVGESHLEKLGSLEGVLEEKLDLLRCMAPGGRCVVGDEPPVLADRARNICSSVRVAGWSERADAELRPADYEVDAFGRYQLRWKGHVVRVPVPGRHGVVNALLALAVSDLLGVEPGDAARGLASAATGALRSEMRRIGDLTVIVDCYNANPQSVRAALELLELRGAASRSVAVLGTMLELGSASERLHTEVLAEALERDIDLVVATGAFGAAAAGLDLGNAHRVVTAPDWKEAYPALRERLQSRDVVLLKASRGVALEGVLPLLEADFARPEASTSGEATAGAC